MTFTPFAATIGNLIPPLPVADGGTGLTASPITVALGGTGATTAAAALAALGGMVLQAATALAGYTVVNSTGNIITWTAPNDGAMHVAVVPNLLRITSNQTGGQIQLHTNAPDGTANVIQFFAGGGTAGLSRQGNLVTLVQPGTAVTLSQDTAMSAGAAVLWAQIWGA